MYEAWKELTLQVIRGYTHYEFENWTIPCLYVAGKYLLLFAIRADQERKNTNYDASDTMMRKAVATAFARHGTELLTAEYCALEPSKAAEKALTARPGAAKFINEVGIGGGEPEHVEFVLAMQKALVHARNVEASRSGVLLAAMLQQLYALDILEEEGILGW